jgi:hypothetical protein
MMKDEADLQPITGKRRLPTWREMNRDTSPEAEEVLFKLLRETPGWRKWEMMEDMNRITLSPAFLTLIECNQDETAQRQGFEYRPMSHRAIPPLQNNGTGDSHFA